VRINGVPTTVIGVMPQGFSFPQNQDFWLPLVPTPEVRRRDNRDTWFVLGRLLDGITVETRACGNRDHRPPADRARIPSPTIRRHHSCTPSTDSSSVRRQR
jgi:hypothetical protein